MAGNPVRPRPVSTAAMTDSIDATTLRAELAGSHPPALIHVLPEDAFEEGHIPGSHSICVYESAFVQKAGEAFPDKSSPLVVYSLDDRTREAQMAVNKLTSAGYTQVRRLAGGLQAWRETGGPTEGGGPRPETPISGSFVLDAETSIIFWTGRNLFNHHHGAIKLQSGSAELTDGTLTAARFVIDMNSITNADITDPTFNAMLVAHLKSDDFFAVDQHPAAEFIVRLATPISSCTSSTANYHIKGAFTLRGETHPQGLNALIARAPDGSLTAQAEFDFDRTQWGAIYGSGSFFARLAGHVVNDLVHLHLKLVFKPA